MKHAISQLEINLEVVETNEPINRANGNIDQADLELECAKEFREAIEILKNGQNK